ncbi:response regulator [Pseudorhodobacter turbinis]|uniref:response regulator n=1 Tax=Pseudorhodobacter turbinis TaxID=2500533 RepID=UPI00143CE4C6|nr:response regulator [Pseudorhodobacter turbinis]
MSNLVEETTPAANSAPTPQGKNEISGEADIVRILVVDDVAANREILRRWLGRRGFEVIVACDGVEALKVVACAEVDLILLDVMMPNLGGVEVVRAIRSSVSTADLPIIMVSAKSLREDISQCIMAGANDYITKPVDFPVMLARIHEQIKGKTS